jgi:probable phosphoglycerate mutase
MLTYLLRHARTAYSATYRVNGDATVRVRLDRTGHHQCAAARDRLRMGDLATCVVSGFFRAVQTAELLLAGRSVPLVSDTRLNEIDYGMFEGCPFVEYADWLGEHGPWERPSGSRECQREAILRMLDGLRDVLAWPGPRLVVAHGLLLSVVTQARQGTPFGGVFFPEAPYVEPVPLTDDELLNLTGRLVQQIANERCDPTFRGRAVVTAPTTGSCLATFGHGSAVQPAEPCSTAAPNEEEDRHA